MPIIISTKARATAQDPNPEWHYFCFPDDANMALATAAIHKRLGAHCQYVYCEEQEVPEGVTIVDISRAEVSPWTTPAPAQPAIQGEMNVQLGCGAEPPGIQALMCVISSLRDIARFSDEEGGELMSALCALRDWAHAQTVAAPQPAPAEQEEAAQRLRKTLDIDPGDVNDPLRPRYIAGFKSGHAAGRRRAAPAASPTPPAEQQAQLGAVYAELPAPTASIGTDDAWHEAAMRDFADRTHAARLRCKSEQARLATLWGYVRADAAPKAAPAPLSESIDQLERELAIIGVVGAIDGHAVVRRESVLEIARRAAIAAQGGK